MTGVSYVRAPFVDLMDDDAAFAGRNAASAWFEQVDWQAVSER